MVSITRTPRGSPRHEPFFDVTHREQSDGTTFLGGIRNVTLFHPVIPRLHPPWLSLLLLKLRGDLVVGVPYAAHQDQAHDQNSNMRVFAPLAIFSRIVSVTPSTVSGCNTKTRVCSRYRYSYQNVSLCAITKIPRNQQIIVPAYELWSFMTILPTNNKVQC